MRKETKAKRAARSAVYGGGLGAALGAQGGAPGALAGGLAGLALGPASQLTGDAILGVPDQPGDFGAEVGRGALGGAVIGAPVGAGLLGTSTKGKYLVQFLMSKGLSRNKALAAIFGLGGLAGGGASALTSGLLSAASQGEGHEPA